MLITDGYDEHSQAPLEQAMEAVRQLHGTLYTIGINGAAGMSIRGREALKQLAAGTGGKAFFPNRDEELPLVHDRVAADVASRYLLTYTPTNQERDGLWRKVRVATGNPALTSARAKATSRPRRPRSGRRSSSSPRLAIAGR